MKRLAVSALVCALAFAAAPLLAENGSNPGRGSRVVTRPGSSGAAVEPKAATAGYTVQVNVVTRVQGTSFFRTAIDVTNNTSTAGVTATHQFCYTSGGVFQGCSQRTAFPTLLALDNFHTDDIVQYIGSLGLLVPGADTSSFGTLLVDFTGLPSNHGWEGTVTARTYSPYSQANPALGTVAIAYPGSLFFESSFGTLVGTIRDTRPAPTDAGVLRTNLGVTNTDVFGFGPVNAQISFYDVTPGSPTAGQRVGNFININNLAAGEVRQFNDVFSPSLGNIPAGVLSCIAFVDVTSPIPNPQKPPQIEGYIVILDGGTQDGAYFEMKCAVGCPT
ncbi:MAG: hypothetical protein WAU32_08435, partial [Thermoanaerobaculia bacterium]